MLSRKTKYAINALLHLAREYGRGPLRVGDLAVENNIPQKFLEAILLELRNAGILGSKKGKSGGYYLMKRPEDVNLAQVLRLMDGAIALLPCVSLNYYERCLECRDEDVCSIREAFLEARTESVRVFESHSLRDLVTREAVLIQKKSKRKARL
jgi:Rrf2 family protein